MGFSEPVVRPALLTALAVLALGSGSTLTAHADPTSPTSPISPIDSITQIFNATTGWHPTGAPVAFETLVAKARRAVEGRDDFKGIFTQEDPVQFVNKRAAADSYSTTIAFQRTYNGLEIIGHDAMVHFSRDGEIHDVGGKEVNFALTTEPSLPLATALKLINDRAGQQVELSETSKLKVLKDFAGKVHLVYHMLTRSTATYAGEQLFLDAHTGETVLAFPRALDLDSGPMGSGPRTVYSADTDEARQHVDKDGYPTNLNPAWYNKVITNGHKSDQADQSAVNAYRNAGLTYDYYVTHFNRHSYDDQDSRLNSIVHVGVGMNNAFWTDEYHVMAYGDGDGAHLVDMTQGLDVGAHELTHGVTGQTANLMYVGESGALNESYSDFFGKMVANDGNWDIGRGIMSPSWTRRALRNMAEPEEFKQPSTLGGQFYVPTDGPCTKQNDHCGVHANSGVPNKAAVMIFSALGKEKAEVLYYKVLTTRLTPTSTFADARRETEQECGQMFGDSDECRAVSAAFDAVRM